MGEEGSYEGALEALLMSPLHQARSKEDLAKAAARRTRTISDMQTYLRRLNLRDYPIPHVVHVTGTKGKGSTCCLCESILRVRYGHQTGLFTSPHLVDIRERIRINGRPISKRVFAQIYWQVRNRLQDNATVDDDDDPELPVLPGYFRMLTLMALFGFAHYDRPKLDVIILEVGMGGRYDATNILDLVAPCRTVVCGVTLLDLDHTRVLGDTLEKIAWEKGGIFRTVKGRPPSSETTDDEPQESFFVVDTNTEGVLSVLANCAREEGNGRKLRLVGNSTQAVPKDAVIGLPGDHQRINAELALALCQAMVEQSSTRQTINPTDDTLYQALATATWPGRCQTVALPNDTPTNLRLDGSHTPISLRAGYEWFCSVSKGTTQDTQPQRVLIFNCSHERNPVELLQILLEKPDVFHKAYFCRSDFERPSAVTKQDAASLLRDMTIQPKAELLPNGTTVITWQMTLESIWRHLELEANARCVQTRANLTVGEALEQISKEVQPGFQAVEIFLVGSLYIVGSALSAIGWSECEAVGELQALEH